MNGSLRLVERPTGFTVSADTLHLRLGGRRSVAVPLELLARVMNVPEDTRSDRARDHAFTALMAEYQFTSGLIPLYRGYQMTAVGFGMSLYAAAIGLLGAFTASDRFAGIVESLGAFVTWPIAILVLAFWVMEIRIKRVSRYIDMTLSDTLDQLLGLEAILGSRQLLKWERAPGRHLTKLEKWMSGSQAFILLLAFPALAASGWFLFDRRPLPWQPMDVMALLGSVLLLGFVVYTSHYSAGAEQRADLALHNVPNAGDPLGTEPKAGYA